MANSLFEFDSLNVQFFGALTYTVQLNQIKNNLDNLDLNQVNLILFQLFNHIKKLVTNNNNTNNLFIVKKLFSDIAIIYNSILNSDDLVQWLDPISTLIQFLNNNSIELNICYNANDLIQLVNSDNKFLLLELSTIILEDFTKNSNVKNRFEILHNYFYQSIKSILLISFEQQQQNHIDPSLIKYLTPLTQFVTFAELSSIERFNDINDLFIYLIKYLNSENENVDEIIEFLVYLFEENPKLMNIKLRDQLNSIIFSDWSLRYLNNLTSSRDFDLLNNFSSLITLFLEIDLLKLNSQLFLNDNSEKLNFLLNLTKINYLPIIEENISKIFINFWIQVIEIFIDDADSLKEIYLKNNEILFKEIELNFINFLSSLSQIYFDKINFKFINESDFNEFNDELVDYRNDVTDLFDSIYTKLGHQVYLNLISTILNSVDLNEIETCLFLLTSIIKNLNPISINLEIMNSTFELFNQNFLIKFNELIQEKNQDKTSFSSLNNYYIKTSIKFLGSIEFFYNSKIGEVYLNLVINYLFNCLKNFPNQQFIISKILLEICDNCRKKLINSISNFEPFLIEIIKNPVINSFTRSKFLNSISCIIQSISDPELQENHVYHMIELIFTTCSPFLQRDSLQKEELDYLISLYDCFYQIGKGLIVPDDDDDAEEEESQQSAKEERKQLFINYHKQSNYKIQTKLNEIIKIFAIDSTLSENTEIIEKTCLIYKVGLLEDYGSFSFKYQDIIDFCLLKLNSKNIVNLLSFLLILLKNLINVGFLPTNSQFLQNDQVILIIENFIFSNKSQELIKDPDNLVNSIELINSIINKKIDSILYNENYFNLIINLCLNSLMSKEKLIIKSVSKFWVSILTVKKISKDDSEFLRNKFIDQNLNIGENLALVTITSLIDSSRSDIEYFSNIIIQIISKYQLYAKRWFENSLIKINESRVSRGLSEMKNMDLFIKKLMITRGSSRKCSELIKQFWIETNGMISYSTKSY